ncbi:MAG: DUF1186 domain-containing protein [Prosthecobacter sp.]
MKPSPIWTVEKILEAFAQSQADACPREAIDAAHDHQEALIPHLQAAVDQAHALSSAGRLQQEGDWRPHSFALHLLAAWRIPGTYERIMHGLTLADRYDSRWLMGEAYRDWPHLLVTTFDGDVPRLMAIVSDENPAWSCELRQGILLTLSGIYHYDLADRSLIQDGFDALLDNLEDALLLETLMQQVALLKIHDLLPKVWGLLRTSPLRKKLSKLDIQSSFERSWDAGFTVSASQGTPIQNPREDLAVLIQSWHVFLPPLEMDPEEACHPAIARMIAYEDEVSDYTCRPTPFILRKRTLPCTCRSGLPYGACCAQR